MDRDQYNLTAAQECIKSSLGLIDQLRHQDSAAIKESNIRHSFTSYLRLIFPEVPWWVEDHILRGEANSAFSVSGKKKMGFVDNLVGLTAIEYESDLSNSGKFDEGIRQVKNYCAALVNEGHDSDLIIGVLSDTISWRAYKIRPLIPLEGMLGGEHLELTEIENIDLASADNLNAQRLVSFLLRHLGRKGSRPLSALTIARDLGFESQFCANHSNELLALVNKAFATNPKYAELIASLWCSFVTYLRDKGSAETFEVRGYADELYILTLAKLICANVIEKKALLSDDEQLEAILDGSYFLGKGIANLVEYDYFGWINTKPFNDDLLPVAHALQFDLEAYDFTSAPAEDLFGRLMAQLAKRTQRLLLGQEWTPAWLANQLVNNVISKLPEGTMPRLVDMCCGSGAMVVEVVKRAKVLIGSGTTTEHRIQQLSQAVTGFDIDPLAVMLSKINWVLAAQDWLEPLGGSVLFSIPVYHADSLFAATPLSRVIDKEEETPYHKLNIAEYTVDLPSFLLTPQFQPFFDALLDRSYSMTKASTSAPTFYLSDDAVSTAIESAISSSSCKVDVDQHNAVKGFFRTLVEIIDRLHRDGRNGIWAFILRNSYRPGLVAGQFNGIVSNPPWLAMSKIADNPYKGTLRIRAEDFGIKPEGASHLHIELATIFLLHAINRYLIPGAPVGCIVPETVLNGHQHNPFRNGEYASSKRSVDFSVEEIWRVQKGTFKNEACVLFGSKVPLAATAINPIPGALAAEAGLTPLSFSRLARGNRVAWSDNLALGGKAGFFDPAPFRQGADIMPRTLIFYELTPLVPIKSEVRWRVAPIDKATSSIAFVINDAKENKDFKVTPCAVPGRYVFGVLTSKLLTPFEVSAPLRALLPIKKDASNKWIPQDAMSLASDPQAKSCFDEILSAFEDGSTIQDYFNSLDSDRQKLTQQRIPNEGFLVFTGAGGKLVCSAYCNVDSLNANRLIIDQTLYWATVRTEEEAVYLSGLFNSDAINSIIKEFQPRGAFGERHVHKLAHEATPPFDPLQDSHQDVVDKTRKLLLDYSLLKAADHELHRLLDPNSSTLHVRRRKIREKIQKLVSYNDYDVACRSLYGV